KRGLNVTISTAEEYDYAGPTYNTIIYTGCPGYITDFEKAQTQSVNALTLGGQIILLDIPNQSGYGLLYHLAQPVGSRAHPLAQDVYPRNPYPTEPVTQANWRTTQEKSETMKKIGFIDFEFSQTLTTHPIYSDDIAEEPIAGFDKGDYVAICAYKK